MLPFILNKGILKIDYIISSHMDTDHVGGILTLLEELQVGEVIISKQGESSSNYSKFKKIVSDKKIKVRYIKKKDRLQIEKDIYLDFLWPDNENIIESNILNNNSIVCKLYYHNFSILFTGDIEELAEKKLIEEYKDNINIFNSNVLKVAHHGSKSSSNIELIKMINPEIALIGVGNNNKFGHPNSEVIERFKSLNTKIYRTDLMGEIILTINRKGKMNVKKIVDN